MRGFWWTLGQKFAVSHFDANNYCILEKVLYAIVHNSEMKMLEAIIVTEGDFSSQKPPVDLNENISI